jgi:predicted PurR-regulated permease PerM
MERLLKWGVPRVGAIAISLLVSILLIGGIWYFLANQIMAFTDQFPMLQRKTSELIARLQQYLFREFNIPIAKSDSYLAEARAGIRPLAGRLLGSVAGTMATVFLLPVYTFLLLYYKNLILNFLYEIFAEQNAEEVSTVLRQVRGAIQSYMYGLLLEAFIVASLNTIALLILGVPYAVLMGILGALLNVLPFFGGILAALLPMMVATITKDGYNTQIGIAISYMIIQFTDNHFLIPYIVSAKVRINALLSVVAVLLGGAVWGLSGMFLSIPFIGVLKIIFDRIPEMQPWGRLLGDKVESRKVSRRSAARTAKARARQASGDEAAR